MEIVVLAIFISSQFLPYVYGVRPKEFYWDIQIWTSGLYDWQSFVVIGIPLLLAYMLLIVKIFGVESRSSKLKIMAWGLGVLFAFVLILYFIGIADFDSTYAYENLIYLPFVLPVILSLGLLLTSILVIKEIHIKLDNITIAIITLPVTFHMFEFLFDLDYGGFLLNACFIILYLIALLKLLIHNKLKDTG